MRIAKQLRYASFLIDEVKKGPEGQCREQEQQLIERWGTPKSTHEPTKDGKFYRLKTTYPKVRTDEDRSQCEREYRQLYEAQQAEFQDRKHRLFRHIERYLTRWWD